MLFYFATATYLKSSKRRNIISLCFHKYGSESDLLIFYNQLKIKTIFWPANKKLEKAGGIEVPPALFLYIRAHLTA
jgi:hypothetical protein